MEWEALEYKHFEKTPNWFFGVGVVGALAFILSLFLKNFLFAIIALVGAFAIMMYGARPPERVKYALLPRGIKVRDRVYLYENLKSFWVEDEPVKDKIIVESEKIFLPHLIIPLGEGVAPEAVRVYLKKFLPEVRHQESFVDALSDYLGF